MKYKTTIKLTMLKMELRHFRFQNEINQNLVLDNNNNSTQFPDGNKYLILPSRFITRVIACQSIFLSAGCVRLRPKASI